MIGGKQVRTLADQKTLRLISVNIDWGAFSTRTGVNLDSHHLLRVALTMVSGIANALFNSRGAPRRMSITKPKPI